MNTEWSLDSLYKGYDDEAFISDLNTLNQLVDSFKSYVANLSNYKAKEALPELIKNLEQLNVLLGKVYSYVMLRKTVNTTDSETVALLGKIDKLHSTMSKELAMVDKYISKVDNIEDLIASNETLKGYNYYLLRIKDNAKYALSDEVEEVIAKLNLSAGSAWVTMQEYLTSTVEVDYNGEKTTLPMIRNLAYSNDQSVRKAAYEAELACYDKIKAPVAFSLNSIKTQVNTIVDLRGYSSALDLTLHASAMKKETLDAMFTAIDEYLPKFHSYLRRKGEVLGHKNGLPWYDLFAPMGSFDKVFTIEESKDYLISNFKGFSDDLANMVAEAYDNAWIDFLPHAGKVGGAFCQNLPYIKESRILTNFDGALGDVVTLAHELGHAYHGLNIQDHLPLNTDYSMPVAETASTFNEIVILNAAIKDATGDEKLSLIESQLQDATQIICDIYSRYLFETAVFEKSKEGFLFPDELEQIMLDSQKKAYGDGLDHNFLHPYMWVCKGHYYSETLSFYNFPYAFGGLFARGLYAIYQQEGSSFVPKYRDLLNATTVKSVEDVAAMADINLTSPDFWKESLKTIASSIDTFLDLTK
jgi:pepF/M3 family oligoendopeptidase